MQVKPGSFYELARFMHRFCRDGVKEKPCLISHVRGTVLGFCVPCWSVEFVFLGDCNILTAATLQLHPAS